MRYHAIIILLLLCTGSQRPVGAQDQIKHIPLPSDQFQRVPVENGSFAAWLRQLPLKNKDLPVLDYRGKIFKTAGDSIVAAVINIDIEGCRLEQCMDIIVRLYADYLWESHKTAGLVLPLPGGYRLAWDEWKMGSRPYFEGIKVIQHTSAKADSSKSSYRKYLDTVYAASHTQQFYFAYKAISRRKVAIGDFIVKKGSKGHAVMIVDLAENKHGELIALIGNGDTPACQFFLLNGKNNQPWVPLLFDKENLELPLRRKMTWDGLRRFDLITDRE